MMTEAEMYQYHLTGLIRWWFITAVFLFAAWRTWNALFLAGAILSAGLATDHTHVYRMMVARRVTLHFVEPKSKPKERK